MSEGQEMFKVFVDECAKARAALGMGYIRVEHMHGVPEGFPPAAEAGSLLAKECGKALVFLNPDRLTSRTSLDVVYLAWHEMVELLLTHKLKMFALDAARGKFDREAWEKRVHEVIHSLVGAIKPECMTSVLHSPAGQPRRGELYSV